MADLEKVYLYCDKCKIIIEKKVHDYSKEKLNRALCYRCQKNKKPTTKNCVNLYNELKKLGCKVMSEKWDHHKHIDIAIPSAKINIEVDGIHHNSKNEQALSDLERTFHSLMQGYVTIRIPNVLVRDQGTLKKTAERIKELVEKYESIK